MSAQPLLRTFESGKTCLHCLLPNLHLRLFTQRSGCVVTCHFEEGGGRFAHLQLCKENSKHHYEIEFSIGGLKLFGWYWWVKTSQKSGWVIFFHFGPFCREQIWFRLFNFLKRQLLHWALKAKMRWCGSEVRIRKSPLRCQHFVKQFVLKGTSIHFKHQISVPQIPTNLYSHLICVFLLLYPHQKPKTFPRPDLISDKGRFQKPPARKLSVEGGSLFR